MKNNLLCVVVAALLLTGCVNRAGEYGDASVAQWEKMKAATIGIQPELDRCAHGKKTSEIPRKDFIKYVVCFNEVEEAKLLPVVNYPHLYRKVMAIRSENASLYAQGKIDFEQYKARSKLALMEFADEAVKSDEATYRAYAAKDQADNEEIARGLASFRQPPTTRTDCYSMGRSTSCTSRTSNY